MQTTSVPRGGHGRSAALVHRNTDKGRSTQDADSVAIASTDQRKREKGKRETHEDKHPTYMKETETQIETVELPKAKATSIKRKAGYSRDWESEHKKKRADRMVIDTDDIASASTK